MLALIFESDDLTVDVHLEDLFVAVRITPFCFPRSAGQRCTPDDHTCTHMEQSVTVGEPEADLWFTAEHLPLCRMTRLQKLAVTGSTR